MSCRVAPGEASKTLENAGRILEFLAQNQLTRKACLVALGGGVGGDLAGFCAAVYLRGVDFVQIPTTFLAAIDSSVGGKTGVNLSVGKNLAGAFWQPRLVVCDCDTFNTLPGEVMADGVAEAIKYGVIFDENLFSMMDGGRFLEKLDRVVERCVDLKSGVTAADEFDRGQRQLLNFGHTVGHAVEKRSGFAVTHGHAVAVGMVIAAQAAEAMGVCAPGCAEAIRDALVKNALPVSTPYSPDELLPLMYNDKKRAGIR